MTLKLLTAEKTSQTKSEELLNAYLKGACVFIGTAKRNEVADCAKAFLKNDEGYFNAYYDKPATKDLLTSVNEADISKKEKELKMRAKTAPFKAKLNYAFNVEARKHDSLSVLVPSIAALPGLSVSVNAAEQGSLEGFAIGMAGIGVAVGTTVAAYKVRKGLEAKNPAEQRAIDDYIAAKHSLVALKQLKKAIQKENGSSNMQMAQRFLAAGFGNPGGMITTPAILKQKANGR